MRCPSCGEDNPERAKFCLACGTPLAAAESRESRRTVTVVFADMVGFTSLGESLDQESLRRVMDRFYAEMRTAIESESGTLAKFIGDAVLAVWGTPVVREDDALRAVRAADAMRRALAGLNEDLDERWGVRVGMRTGVNTGEVVVDPGRPADLLVGDTLNVAARLEQAAADGEVLVGPDTYRLVRHDTTLEAVEPLALKGKARPMPAWRVVDARRRDRRADARLQAPLVGRSSELAALTTAFDEVARSRSCRITTVIGSPGLGKTRLVGEFARSVAGQATVLHGRCQATGEGMTFQPVAEVLRGAAGIGDDDSPETAAAKLGAVLPAGEPDRERVVEHAAGLLGLGPAASTEETFWAVRRVLEALARERPVVLVHDDIHWGQPTFLDLLEHFAAWIRDAPVMVLALARPELREIRPVLADGAIALQPLDGDASRALVAGLLGSTDLPERLAERILATTEGNPLFLGETLRMLADEGVLRREGDAWVAGDAADVTVPPTINALLSARIERLEDDERSVVERAAVIGHAFYRGAVTALAPAPVQPRVDGALETLSRKELVRPEDEWWLDEQVFRFHHVLIRDAAYRSLLKEARAELHERFAAWLEAKAGELAGEHEEVIAFHLEQAHAYRLELGPLDEAGRALAARAAARLHSAGRRALAREDLPAAVNLLTRALAPRADDAARLTVLVDLAEALLSAGDTGAAQEVVEDLGLGAAERGDDRLQAWTAVFACQLDNLTGAGRVRETVSAASAAAQTLAAAGDRAGEAKAHQVVAQAEALLGQVAAAEAALDRALVAARAAGDQRRITAVLSGAPRAALWGPAPIVRASGRCLDVVRILRMTPGNRHVEASALRSQAVLEAMRGRAEAARGILDGCRVTLEELGLALELHETAIHAGTVELLAGEPGAAEAQLRDARDGLRALGVEGAAAQAAALLARALLGQDRDDEALEATAFAEEHGGEDLKTAATWLGVRAELRARAGDHDAARDLARRAVALTEPTDALADRADALMALAAVEHAAGDEAAARAAAAAARDLYAAKDHTVGVERAAALAGDAPLAAEPAAVSDAAPPGGSPSAERRRRYLEAHASRDLGVLDDLYAEDFGMVDTRQLGWAPAGRDEVIASNRSVAAFDPEYRVSTETLLDEGLLRAEVLTFAGTTPDGDALETVLGLIELGGEQAVYCEIWDPEDREGMLARAADLRVLAPTATGRHSPEIAVVARFLHAYNRHDWGGVRAGYHDDFVGVDHRPVGWESVVGADAMIDFLRSSMILGDDVRQQVDRVFARSDRAIAVTSTTSGHPATGGEFAVAVAWISIVGDAGLITHTEWFDPDDEAGILARFAELTAAADAAPPVWARLAADAWQAAFDARDWDAFGRLYAPDAEVVDGRAVVQGSVSIGREGIINGVRAGADLGGKLGHWRFVAVPASHVAVISQTMTSESPDGRWEIEFHQLVVSDREGRILRVESADDVAMLVRRAHELAAEPPPSAAERSARRFVAAFAARDWDAVGAEYEAGAGVEDARTGIVAPMHGADGVVGVLRSYVAESPDVVWDVVGVESRGEHVALVTTRMRGTDPSGGSWELVAINLGEMGDDGLVRRGMIFDEERRDEARATMDQWAAAHATALAPWVERSALTDVLSTWIAAINARDLDGLARLVTGDFRLADHRPGVRHVAEGPDALTGMWTWVFDTVPDVFAEALVLQAAGETLHVRMVFSSHAADYEIVTEMVIAFRDGLGHTTDVHEAGDPAAAARFAELTRASEPLTVTLARRWRDSFNARDWEAGLAQQSPDYFADDRRTFGAGLLRGGEGGIEAARAIVDLAPDARWDYEPIDAGDDAGLFEMTVTGHGPDGGAFHATTLHVVVAAPDGRTAGNVIFDLDQRAEAEAEHRAWVAHLVQARHTAEVLTSHDFDRVLAELWDPSSFRQIDHRPFGAATEVTAEGLLDTLREMVASAPDLVATVSVVAVAGDRRVSSVTYRGHHRELDGGEMEVVLWTVSRIDGLRTISSHLYDTREDAEASLREASASEPLVLRHARTFAEAFNARDWPTIDALSTDDVVVTDHRPLGAGVQPGRMGQVSSIPATIPGARWHTTPLEVLGERRALFRVVIAGDDPTGGRVELAGFQVDEIDAEGRSTRVDFFPDEDAARAWLAATSRVSAREAIRAWAEAHNAHDVDGLAARFAEGFVLEDHRPLVRHRLEREETIESWRRGLASVPDLQMEVEVLDATEQAALCRHRWTGRGGSYLIELDAASRVDEQGRLVVIHAYEVGDPAARERFDVLADRHGHLGQAARTAELLNAGRIDDLLAEQFEEDFAEVDHRQGVASAPVGPREFGHSIEQGRALVPDLRLDIDVVAVDGPRRLAVHRFTGTSPEGGGPVEMIVWCVVTLREGRIAVSDIYGSEAEARERFAADADWERHRRQLAAFADAANDRDFERIRHELISDDFTQADRRPLGAGRVLDADGFVDSLRDGLGLVPDATASFSVIAVNGDRRAVEMVYRGHSSDGGLVELPFWSVAELRGDMQMSRTDLYASREEALAALADE